MKCLKLYQMACDCSNPGILLMPDCFKECNGGGSNSSTTPTTVPATTTPKAGNSWLGALGGVFSNASDIICALGGKGEGCKKAPTVNNTYVTNPDNGNNNKNSNGSMTAIYIILVVLGIGIIALFYFLFRKQTGQ